MATVNEIKRVLDMLTVAPTGQLEALGATAKGHTESLRSVTNSKNVVALGISEKISNNQPTGQLALTFYVEKKVPLRKLRADMAVPPTIPVSLSGDKAIPTDVVVIGKLVPEVTRKRKPNVLTKPMHPGNSIGHVNVTAGTLGAVVTDGTNHFLLSNSHVLANSGLGKKGNGIVYPGIADGGINPDSIVAKLHDFHDFTTGGEYVNRVDCAIAKPTAAGLANLVADIKVLGLPKAVRGMKLVKVGRTRGKTEGEVKDVHFRFILDYEGVGEVGFVDQVFCTRYSEGGDSGSLVLDKATVPVFSIKDEFIAYASPDSTYAVTRRLFDAAQEEIIIGIYDFSADYMRYLVLNTMQRGVKVLLMLDIDNLAEKKLFDELDRFGCDGVAAPSCASKTVSYFPSSHEKVIVIDGTWTLVQSGNYSTNSIPFNEKDGGDPNHFVNGNRDMGIAIKSKPLAAFFAKILKSDMKLELDAEQAGVKPGFNFKELRDLVEAVPKSLPAKLFPSKTFNPSQVIKVTPVLTPDNYMDVIPALLESAKHSIFIENQYIRSTQPDVVLLLQAIKKAKAKNPALDMRIVLGKLFGQEAIEKERKNIENLKTTFELTLG